MTRIVVFSLCLLLTVRSISCIDCYSCISTEDEHCLHPDEDQIKKQKCDNDGLRKTGQYATQLNSEFKQIFDYTTIENAIPLSCLKQVVMVKGQEVVFRGCQLPRDTQNQLDVCKKVYDIQNKNNVHVLHCSLCDSDGCNSAPALPSSSRLAALGAFLLGALALIL